MRLYLLLFLAAAVLIAGVSFAAARRKGEITAGEAAATAANWMLREHSYQAPEPLRVKRYSSLPETPKGRAVYGVTYRREQVGIVMCWAILVDARSGVVYKAVSGDYAWLKCN
jgi:hypothetical protein